MDLDYFRKELSRQKAEILKDASSAVEGGDLNVVQSEMADTVDRSSVESDRNFTLRILDRERKLLKKIEEALERIESGSFGECESCEEDIDEKRLRARPVATLCIECKEKEEEEEGKG